MEIDFGYIFRSSTKPVWRGIKIKTIENSDKEYKEILAEG